MKNCKFTFASSYIIRSTKDLGKTNKPKKSYKNVKNIGIFYKVTNRTLFLNLIFFLIHCMQMFSRLKFETIVSEQMKAFSHCFYVCVLCVHLHLPKFNFAWVLYNKLIFIHNFFPQYLQFLLLLFFRQSSGTIW